MTIAITITDGTNTINLSGTDGYTEGYQPAPGEVGADSVVETLGATFTGGNAAIDTALAKLERLFQQSRDRQKQARGIAPVYFKVQLDSATWRSELYDGKIIATPDWLHGERAAGTRKSAVILEHAPWWEADASVSILLTNGNGTDQATLKIYNNNSGAGSSPNKQNNYAKIPAAQLTGDLPAPAFLQFQDGVANNLTDLIVANNVYSDPANLVPWYEGETGSGDTADASCSGGNYHQFGSAATITVEKTITSETPRMMASAYRVLARLRSTADWKIFPFFRQTVSMITGPTLTLPLSSYGGFYLWDLGIVPFFQTRDFSSGSILTYASSGFGFRATKATAGTIDVDYLQLTPLDGWKRAQVLSFSTPNWIYLDEASEKVYSVSNTGTLINSGVSTGAPILLYPGRENRLHFSWLDWTVPESVPATYGNLQVSYRPRRRAL